MGRLQISFLFGGEREVTEFLCRQSLTVPLRTRHLHKFIGAALGTRNEVLSILHLSTSQKPSGTTPARTMLQ